VPHETGAAPGTSPKYGKGRWDFAFVLFYIIILSFTREFIMQKFLRPMARRSGLKSRAKQSRFMEQMYTAIYFGFTGVAGLWVMSRTPLWYFNTRAMYEGFPHKTHDADFKFYYLFQAAYWSQQAIVLLLGMEKPRKDFKELVGHHIVTLALIGLSYRFHFTYMGLGVFITHDISDFFLAVSSPSPSCQRIV
jgi:acyl-CoA-dependent ceramide synthase